MAADEQIRVGLGYVREQTDRFVHELQAMGEDAWRGATNCPPWDVQTLAAHVARSAESFTTALERGRRGILEPALSKDARLKRVHDIAAQGPQGVLKTLKETADSFEELVASLDPQTPGIHVYGPRSATWFVQQRLAEVVFHLWDLRVSLGLTPELDETVARWLLPMLVESNLPAAYGQARGGDTAPPSAESDVAAVGTSDEGSLPALSLVVEGAPDLAWTLRPGLRELSVAKGIEGTVTIRGDAAALALLVYGRQKLADLGAEGRLAVIGDRTLAERFGELFPTP
jgi:uncharacterized protein (TIGR03083 family)